MNTRNGHFLSPPRPEQRLGRYVVGGSDILIFAPVEAGTDVDANGQRELTLRTTAVAPKRGKHGILVVEPPFSVVQGIDPVLFGQGEYDTATAGSPAQLVSGDNVRFRLINTEDDNFEFQREIAGRTMVAGRGATPTLNVDDYIGPGPGDDDGGYWQEADLAHAWAVVTAVYDTGEIDAQMVF